MILTCNECGAGFNFDEHLLKETGSKVRCSKCKKVFTAYPPSSAGQHEKADFAIGDEQPVAPGTESSPDTSNDDGIELKNIDLEEIEGILGMDNEPDAGDASTQGSGELDLDFSTEEDEGKATLESTLESEKTEALDISDMDNILKEDGSPEGTLALDLSDMENILKVEDDATKESESSQEEESGIELGVDFDTDENEGEIALESTLGLEKTEELDLSGFENILDKDEEPETKSVSTDETTGLDLDFDIDDSSDKNESDFELEETVELDLSEMDNVLEVEDDESKITESAADEDLDFTLDLGLEDEKEQDDKIPESTVAEAEVSDDLDFELDLDMDEGEGTDSAESELKPELESEDIQELDLSDMEDGTGEIDKQTTEDTYDEKTEELDLELDLVTEEGEDSDNDSLAVELGDAEEFDLSDLDSILDEEDKQIRKDVPTEEIEELELDLDIEDDIADAPDVKTDDKAPEIHLESTEKFDLSDIDQMIDTDEITKIQDTEPEEVELDFEIDGDAQDLFGKDETIEEQAVPHIEEKLDDTFDMGALKDESDAEDADDFTDSKKAKTYAPKRKPAGKKRLSGPIRILLIFVLLFGGAFAAHEILNSMGIKISVTDTIREIPFVGDLLKPDVKDVGNLYVNIFEKTVKGKFVDNPKIGTLFVVTGQIKNEYEHSRRFIRITGKIYKKGRALVKTETIYCGNLLSETELKNLNHVAITKRLKNRFGDKRINMKVNKGQALQFMIVFPNVPSGLEEYSVQVAGSEKS